MNSVYTVTLLAVVQLTDYSWTREGVRIKILQNGSDVVDITISPDHAIAADSLLAQQVEIVRVSTLLMRVPLRQVLLMLSINGS